MPLKEGSEDVSTISCPAGWAEELARELADVRHGRLVDLADILADIDMTLAAMINDGNDQTGHGEADPDGPNTDSRFES